jgi:hypothetical protein
VLATHQFLRPALAAALLLAALALWLSGARSGEAATQSQTQGVSAAVAQTISWGSAGPCTQDISAYDFGTLSAGAAAESTLFTGCVSSNASWSVTASMTSAPSNAAEAATLPGSAFVGRVTSVPSGGSTGCSATNTTCTLDQSRTLVSGANRSARSFSYKYNLSVPADSAGGSYTGGAITLVASN